MIVIEDILGRCAPLLGVEPEELRRTQLLRARAGHPVRAAGAARRTAGRRSGRILTERSDFAAPQGRDRRVQRRAPGHQARAGDDAGEVRHLVQPDRVQPGRRAGARLQGRLGADQPRRHRDGPGPAHQDDPGRGDRARRAAELRAAGPDPDRQGAQHLGHRGQLRRGPQRRRGQERLRPDPGAAGNVVAGGQARHPPRRRAVRRRHGHRHRLPRQADRLGRAGARRLLPAGPAVGGRLLPHRRAALGRRPDAGRAVQVLRLRRRRAPRSRSTGSPARTGCGGRTSCTTSATACRR